VNYALGQCPRIKAYLDDARLRPDNNLGGNAIRTFVVVGKTNSSPDRPGAQGRASACTLTSKRPKPTAWNSTPTWCSSSQNFQNQECRWSASLAPVWCKPGITLTSLLPTSSQWTKQTPAWQRWRLFDAYASASLQAICAALWCFFTFTKASSPRIRLVDCHLKWISLCGAGQKATRKSFLQRLIFFIENIRVKRTNLNP
jgi:hypothetical protein